jgi:hypothetical protein
MLVVELSYIIGQPYFGPFFKWKDAGVCVCVRERGGGREKREGEVRRHGWARTGGGVGVGEWKRSSPQMAEPLCVIYPDAKL